MSAVAEYVMPEGEARRLTERIRVTAHTYAEAREKLIGYVEEAKAGNAHIALGYRSWTEYLSEVLGEEPMRLARDERREVVQLLSGEGMSTRTIAPIVGVTQQRVSQLQREVTSDLSPAPEQPTTPEAFEAKYGMRPDEADALISSGTVATREEFDAAAENLANVDKRTGEIHDQPARKVTGRDGKSYTRPAPTKPRRRPLPEQVQAKAERAMSDALDIKAALDDDRFPSNRDSITELSFNRLRAAALAITDFLAELNPSAVVETEEVRDRLVADLNHISETFHRLAQSLQEEPQ